VTCPLTGRQCLGATPGIIVRSRYRRRQNASPYSARPRSRIPRCLYIGHWRQLAAAGHTFVSTGVERCHATILCNLGWILQAQFLPFRSRTPCPSKRQPKPLEERKIKAPKQDLNIQKQIFRRYLDCRAQPIDGEARVCRRLHPQRGDDLFASHSTTEKGSGSNTLTS
jgi:hypothetical protein